MGNFVQFLTNSYKIFYKTTYQKSFIIGLESPQGGLVSSLFKLGRSDLYLQFLINDLR